MSRAAGRDHREPRVACGLRRLPGVGPGQVARPELGGVAQVGRQLAREAHHEGTVGDGAGVSPESHSSGIWTLAAA